MVTHVVVFRFREGVPAAERGAILRELNDFPNRFAAMKRWRLGENVSDRDQSYSHAFVVEFDTAQELTDYLHSQAHEQWVRERWVPFVESRVIVSFEHPEPAA